MNASLDPLDYGSTLRVGYADSCACDYESAGGRGITSGALKPSCGGYAAEAKPRSIAESEWP